MVGRPVHLLVADPFPSCGGDTVCTCFDQFQLVQPDSWGDQNDEALPLRHARHCGDPAGLGGHRHGPMSGRRNRRLQWQLLPRDLGRRRLLRRRHLHLQRHRHLPELRAVRQRRRWLRYDRLPDSRRHEHRSGTLRRRPQRRLQRRRLWPRSHRRRDQRHLLGNGRHPRHGLVRNHRDRGHRDQPRDLLQHPLLRSGRGCGLRRHRWWCHRRCLPRYRLGLR